MKDKFGEELKWFDWVVFTDHNGKMRFGQFYDTCEPRIKENVYKSGYFCTSENVEKIPVNFMYDFKALEQFLLLKRLEQ